MAKDVNYSELLDLRTHLTVAMLASSQLKRKDAQSEDSARLFAYLIESLTQMQSDIIDLESLVGRLEQEQEQEQEQELPPAARSWRRFPPRWIGIGMVFIATKLRGFLPARPLALHHSLPMR